MFYTHKTYSIILSKLFFRFCLLNVLSLYTYTTAFQKVDDEEFGGTWELIKEGFMTSFASFLVSII